MRWFYTCPSCGSLGLVLWREHGQFRNCHACLHLHVVPSPWSQLSAYVDSQDYPDEMAEVVIRLKGTRCTVPGCGKAAEVLDHRRPYSRGGRTSVENLFPMCELHNLQKGDQDYGTWLAIRRVTAELQRSRPSALQRFAAMTSGGMTR